jgi:hypothetical protein
LGAARDRRGLDSDVATDASGFASFQWTTPSSRTISRVLVTEEDPAASRRASSTTLGHDMRRAYPDTAGDVPLPVTPAPNGFRATITHESIATCTMVNRVPPKPAIQVEKETNGSNADLPPGPPSRSATRSPGHIA